MSRFVKIYPGEWIDHCTIGITEIVTQADDDAEFDVEIQFIRFECFKIRSLARRNEWNQDANLFCVGPEYPTYLAKGHRHSLRDIFWEGQIDADEETTDIEQAQPFLTGYINDDGTSEINFPTQPVFIHNRNYAVQIGNLLNRLYDIAKELLPKFHERRGKSWPEACDADDVPEES